jgi:hypothetical protein
MATIELIEKINRKLYRLTNKLGDFYVIDNDPTSAINKLEGLLNESDYGFYEYRKVFRCDLIANELSDFNHKPFFSSGNKLIIEKEYK